MKGVPTRVRRSLSGSRKAYAMGKSRSLTRGEAGAGKKGHRSDGPGRLRGGDSPLEKKASRLRTVPRTDTGEQATDSQGEERTDSKELGKLTS